MASVSVNVNVSGGGNASVSVNGNDDRATKWQKTAIFGNRFVNEMAVTFSIVKIFKND